MNLSRKDIQRVLVSSKVAIIHDHLLVLLLFWYESGGEHFCVCVNASKSATVSRIEHLGWEPLRRMCFDEQGVCVQTFSAEDDE